MISHVVELALLNLLACRARFVFGQGLFRALLFLSFLLTIGIFMPRRVLNGRVVSNKPDKTVVVLVTRRVTHPLYKKAMTRSKKFMAHDETNACQVGDEVSLIETRPFSKRKCWQVVEK